MHSEDHAETAEKSELVHSVLDSSNIDAETVEKNETGSEVKEINTEKDGSKFFNGSSYF